MSHYVGERVAPRQIDQWRNILQIGQSNQNVLRYFTVCSCNPKNTTIISELCDQDLETYIKNIGENLHFPNSLDLLQGIAQGVQHLHRNGIIHCNIRPSSVLLFSHTKNQHTAK